MRTWGWLIGLIGVLAGCVEADPPSGAPAADGAVVEDAAPPAPDAAVDDATVDDAAVDDPPVLDAAADATPDVSADATVADALPPDADPPPPMPVECRFAGQPFGPLEVNTWRGDVERVSFTMAGLPDPAQIMSAHLEYLAHDADHPDEEGWIALNGQPRLPLPADVALDNQDRRFSIEVTGQTVAGANRVEFIAFEGPDGAYYRISDVQLVVAGVGFACPIAPPVDVVAHPAPAGISAFAALAPDFPTADSLSILAGLQRPFTTVLLDFGPVLDAAGRQMFGPGAVGERQANPAHLAALTAFMEAYVEATPGAAERQLQLYLINGPGNRRPADYPRAYPVGPQALDVQLRDDPAIRAELAGYITALEAAVGPWRDRVAVRLVVGLEDNYTRPTAESLVALAREAGWAGPVGRNPCGCGYGDTARAGDFHEDHPHSLAAVDAAVGRLRPPDAFSNDGWGWTIAQNGVLVDEGAVVAMARAASRSGVWFHLWYDHLQGYPIPANGPRPLRFEVPAARLRDWLQRGLAQ